MREKDFNDQICLIVMQTMRLVVEEYGMGEQEALRLLYASAALEETLEERTGLWKDGPEGLLQRLHKEFPVSEKRENSTVSRSGFFMAYCAEICRNREHLSGKELGKRFTDIDAWDQIYKALTSSEYDSPGAAMREILSYLRLKME